MRQINPDVAHRGLLRLSRPYFAMRRITYLGLVVQPIIGTRMEPQPLSLLERRAEIPHRVS